MVEMKQAQLTGIIVDGGFIDEVDEAAAGGEEDGDSGEHRDLPPDCIEVTMDEEIAIKNSTLRQ